MSEWPSLTARDTEFETQCRRERAQFQAIGEISNADGGFRFWARI